MRQTFDARFVVAAAVAAAVAGAAAAALYFWKLQRIDEDRAVIIVRKGSVELELSSKEWKLDNGNAKKARPQQPQGAHVTDYMVQFVASDMVGGSCPAVPLVGESVEISYKPTETSTEIVKIGREQIGGSSKFEPVVEAPANMTVDAANNKKLIHGSTGVGSIASVKITYGSSSVTCTPGANGFASGVTVRPLR